MKLFIEIVKQSQEGSEWRVSRTSRITSGMGRDWEWESDFPLS